jgi:hypothetical protein
MATPFIFDQAIADEICERLANGESLRSICGSDRDDFIPGSTTVFKWLAENTKFAEQYAHAREAQADAIFDEILDIADDARNDWMERKDAEGQGAGYVENGEHIQRSRIRIDARKWMAGKLKPKKYGEKLGVEHSLDESLRAWMVSRDG